MEAEKLSRNLKMLELWELGMSYAEIARIYEISHSRASRIIKQHKMSRVRTMGSLQEKMKTMPSMEIQAGEPFLIDVVFRNFKVATVEFNIKKIKSDLKGGSGTNIEFTSRLVERKE